MCLVGLGASVATAQSAAQQAAPPVTFAAIPAGVAVDPADPLMSDDVPDPLPESPDAPEGAAGTATPGTQAAVIYPLARFPVQGRCSFTDTYGASRPGGRQHQGVDILAREGKELYAAIDGTITVRYNDRPGLRSGNALRLTGRNKKDYLFYAHLQAFAPGIKAGKKVARGQLLGWVGKTGNAGTPHLHLEIHPNGGAPINPTPSVRRIDACKKSPPPIHPTTTTRPGATTTTKAPPTTPPDTDPWGTDAPSTAVPATTKPRTTTTTRPRQTTTRPRATSTTRPRSTTTTTKPAPTPKPPPAGTSRPTRIALLTPTRVFGTRTGGRRVRAGVVTKVAIAGHSGVPKGVVAAQLNVVVSSPSAGVLSVFPCGAARAGSTTAVAFSAGRVTSNTVLVGLSSGNVCARASTGLALAIDVTGVASNGGAALGVAAVAPVRVADTRASGGRLAAGQTRALQATGLNGIPGANALSVSVTAVNAVASGAVTVWACDRDRPQMPTFTAIAGQATTGNTITRVAADGTICIRAAAAMDVLVDVHAAWAAGGAHALRTITPTRVLNARVSAGVPVSAVVGGRGAVRRSAKLVVVTVTLANAAESGTATVWPCGATKPATRVLTVGRGGRVSGSTVMKLGVGGRLCANATTAGRLTLDITGFAA